MKGLQIFIANDSYSSVISKIGEETFTESFGEQNNPTDFKIYLEESFNQKQIEKEIQEPNSYYLLAYFQNEIVAYARIRESSEVNTTFPNNKCIELQRIYSLKKWKGKGVGKELLNYCIELSKVKGFDLMWLGVWEHNLHAIEFYNHLGFEPFSSHVFMIGSDPQKDILMKKDLV